MPCSAANFASRLAQHEVLRVAGFAFFGQCALEPSGLSFKVLRQPGLNCFVLASQPRRKVEYRLSSRLRCACWLIGVCVVCHRISRPHPHLANGKTKNAQNFILGVLPVKSSARRLRVYSVADNSNIGWRCRKRISASPQTNGVFLA
jgi:hypothetical protein